MENGSEEKVIIKTGIISIIFAYCYCDQSNGQNQNCHIILHNKIIVAVKDENGEIKYDEQGNILTEEQPIEVSADYKKVMEDVMGGNSASVKIKSNGKMVYVSYKPITLQGASAY